MAAAASAAPSARAAGAEVDSALAALPAEFGLSTVQARLLAALMESPDCLLVAAAGMGLDRLLLAALALYCDPRMLVPVLNLQPMEQQLLVDGLTQLMPAHPPLVITNEQPAPERQKLYLRGGVLFVTSRIFVVDLLHGRAPVAAISGIVVANADKVTRLSTEAFILRLYRNANRTGFIKAVTDHAQGFNAGFNAVEKTMKALWVSKLHLWPYFVKEVHQEIEKQPVSVFEVRVNMTERMRRVQQAIFDIMTSCLKHLKRLRPSLDVEQLTIERNLFKSAEGNLKRQLNVEWHTVDPQVRLIVRELKMLRELVMYLDQYDCISFYHHLASIRANTELTNRNAYWYQLDAASELLDQAKYRVFPPKQAGATEKKASENTAESTAAAPTKAPNPLHYTLDISAIEVNPKWRMLEQVLRTIRDARAKRQKTRETVGGDPHSTSLILVCTRDRRTTVQLAHYLSAGPEAVLRAQLNYYQRWKANAKLLSESAAAAGAGDGHRGFGGARGAAGPGRASSRRARAKQRRRATGATVPVGHDDETAALDAMFGVKAPGAAAGSAATGAAAEPPTTAGNAGNNGHTTQAKRDDVGDDSGSSDSSDDENGIDDSQAALVEDDNNLLLAPDEAFEKYFRQVGADDVLLVPMQHDKMTATGDAAVFAQLLRDLQPEYVVLYDPYLPCIRELQLYQTAYPSIRLTNYLMLFTGSFQEQQYLSSIRHEKEAFQQLIATKRTMAVPVDQDGRQGLRQLQERQLMRRPDEEVVSSRQAGGRSLAAPTVRPRVIVDMREFRSSLPGILYEFGLDVEPRTLLVGDYVLSPDICVERKSYSDLVGSLNSGRLHDQAASMTRHYSRAALLIEFDEERPMSSVDNREARATSDIDMQSTMAKLTLLTLTFPKLRLLWSHSPHATAKLFYTLKANAREPDGDTAANVGLDDSSAEYASEPQAVLENLPGVTPYNIYRIMEKVPNLRTLLTLSLPDLQQLCGRRNGMRLHAFLNNTPNAVSRPGDESGAWGGGGGGGGGGSRVADEDAEDEDADEAELIELERQEQEQMAQYEEEMAVAAEQAAATAADADHAKRSKEKGDEEDDGEVGAPRAKR